MSIFYIMENQSNFYLRLKKMFIFSDRTSNKINSHVKNRSESSPSCSLYPLYIFVLLSLYYLLISYSLSSSLCNVKERIRIRIENRSESSPSSSLIYSLYLFFLSHFYPLFSYSLISNISLFLLLFCTLQFPIFSHHSLCNVKERIWIRRKHVWNQK